jgi:hypothetical protein
VRYSRGHAKQGAFREVHLVWLDHPKCKSNQRGQAAECQDAQEKFLRYFKNLLAIQGSTFRNRA